VGSLLSDFNMPAVPIPQIVYAFGSVTSSYTAIATRLGYAYAQMILVSTFDQPVQFSFDGINDWMPILAGVPIYMDMKSDKLVIPAEYGAYVKTLGTGPASGNLYICGFTA
jgi:hypothetical protein